MLASLRFEAAHRDDAGGIDQRAALGHEVVVVGVFLSFIINKL